MKRALTVAVTVLSTACGASLIRLPSGAGTLVPSDLAAQALAQAIGPCSGVRTLTAEIAVRGSVGGLRLRGRLAAGIAAPASARLEAVAPFGAPLFIFVASGNDATLLLPREDRALEHGPPSAVLEAVAGVPLDASDLDSLLTGCHPSTKGGVARQFGDTWQAIAIGGDELYLHRDSAAAPWDLAVTVRRSAPSGGRWRAEFRDRQDGVPRAIRVTSLDENGRTGAAFDVQLAMSQVEVNVPLGPEVFVVQISQSADPITIEELKGSRAFSRGP